MTTPADHGPEPAPAPARQRPTARPAAPPRAGLAALIADALAVRTAARDTVTRAGRLVAALKRHRQQSKLVATTLKSLKQLHTIDG